MKRFIPFDPDQPLLLPPDLRDALPDGHPALLIGEWVDELDLSEIHEGLQDAEWGGKPGFDPRVMVRIWMYAYAVGMRSSRRVAQALVENIAFRVVACNQTPGHWALNRFRTRHREALGNLLVQMVQVAAGVGLVKLANVAIDGTKVKANASKHKAMSYGRMDAAEARLEAEVDAYLESCDEHDARDDETFGPDDDGVSLPEELRSTQARRNKIAAAKRELEQRAKDRKAREQEKRREAATKEGRDYLPRDDAADARPKASDQVNFTDPESRIMIRDGGVVQACNAQAAVDTASHIVVAAQLGNQAADSGYFPSLVNETIQTTGGSPGCVTADAGYYSSNVEHAESLGVEPLLPPDKIRRKEWRAQQAPKGRIPNGLSRKDRMRRRLATMDGKRLYLQRQASVEPVFGTTKAGRGLQQFLHRGVEKNRYLFRFDMAAHSMLKIVRRIQRTLQPPHPTPKGQKVSNDTTRGVLPVA